MHPATIIGTVRLLIVDVAMGQIPRSTERISSFEYYWYHCYCHYAQEHSCPDYTKVDPVRPNFSLQATH